MCSSLTNQGRFSDCELDVGSAVLAPLGFYCLAAGAGEGEEGRGM